MVHGTCWRLASPATTRVALPKKECGPRISHVSHISHVDVMPTSGSACPEPLDVSRQPSDDTSSAIVVTSLPMQRAQGIRRMTARAAWKSGASRMAREAGLPTAIPQPPDLPRARAALCVTRRRESKHVRQSLMWAAWTPVGGPRQVGTAMSARDLRYRPRQSTRSRRHRVRGRT